MPIHIILKIKRDSSNFRNKLKIYAIIARTYSGICFSYYSLFKRIVKFILMDKRSMSIQNDSHL